MCIMIYEDKEERGGGGGDFFFSKEQLVGCNYSSNFGTL